jgi:DNA-binding MurR/RpiR family transcriptional regulator
MLGRLPNRTLADLQKDDVVMIVSTDGADSGAVTAVTLLAGVDAILTAATNRSASTLLSPWSLSAAAPESEAAQQ